MIDRLEKMLREGRDDPMLRFGLGNACYRAGRLAEAAGHLRECVRQDPGYSAAWRTLGRVHMDNGDRGAAREAFEAGLTAAAAGGDKQIEREIEVFLRKLDKLAPG